VGYKCTDEFGEFMQANISVDATLFNVLEMHNGQHY